MHSELRKRIQAWHDAHPALAGAVFFLAGLVFDLATLGRIDETFNLVQQATFLFVITLILGWEWADTREDGEGSAPNRFLKRLKPYRDEVVHFVFGSLLSVFAIFYIKSASLVSCIVFYLVLVTLLVANETNTFRRLGLTMRFALLAMCLASYFFYLVPIFWGRVGWAPFVVGLLLAVLLYGGMAKFLERYPHKPKAFRREVVAPGIVVFSLLFVFYLFRIIPPVPLSLKEIGIYHNVERRDGSYILSEERPAWQFWRSGDQDFVAVPGDVVYCFFRVFSPGGFEDRVIVRWLYDDPKSGWRASDGVPVRVTGGRDGGFRGFTEKRNYQPGDWQVRIETLDHREIGRINFSIRNHDSGKSVERKFRERLT